MALSPLGDFFERSFDEDWFPRVKYSPSESSPCAFGPIDSRGTVRWRPVKRDSIVAIEPITEIAREDVAAGANDFLASFFSASLECRFGYEYLVLDCGAWNDEEFQRKQAEIDKHIEKQAALAVGKSLPLGRSVSGSGCYIGLNLESGEVWAEQPGRAPIEKLADSYSDFLAGLKCVHATDESILATYE